MKLTLLALLLVSSSLALDLVQLSSMQAPIFKAGLGKSISNLQWTDCDGTGTPYIQVSKIDITGNIVAGGTINVHATGNIKQRFTVNSFDITVLVAGIKIYNGNVPVDPPQSYNPGAQDLTFSEPLDLTPPNGAYKVTAKMRDAAGHELQCFFVTFSIS